METGIGQEHLYYACKLFGEFHYEPGNTTPKGTATGFVVQGPDKRTLGLVTNRHFIEPGWSDELKEGTKLTKLRASIWLTSDDRIETDIVAEPIFHDDPTIDACIFPLLPGHLLRVDLYGIAGRTEGAHKWADGLKQGGDAAIQLKHYVSWGHLDISAWYWNTVAPCESLFFPGYPAWHDKSADRPIMRTGAIVSDPKESWRLYADGPKPGDGSLQVLFDAFSSDGNSGSPVFVSQRGFRNAGEMSHYVGAYRPMILGGINAGHIEDHKSRHVGLSRMHKVSVIVDLARKMVDSLPNSGPRDGLSL
ncbi:hypothetical protein ACJH6H_29715 [Mycobacterium sp. SMC-21]|uniref:hypothetical protein n=1 Tax=Mycobacterium sp. SMC-21 TaxID=3381632 RepID=UPI003876232E